MTVQFYHRGMNANGQPAPDMPSPAAPAAPFPDEPGDMPPDPNLQPVREPRDPAPAVPEPEKDDPGPLPPTSALLAAMTREDAAMALMVEERFRASRFEVAVGGMAVAVMSLNRQSASALKDLRPEDVALPAMQSIVRDLARSSYELGDQLQGLLTSWVRRKPDGNEGGTTPR